MAIHNFILIAGVFLVSFPIVRYGKILMERALFDNMHNLHRRTYNMNIVIKAVHDKWEVFYKLRKEEVFLN